MLNDGISICEVIGGSTVDGTVELRQLAHLLRTSASTIRDIASLRNERIPEILMVAEKIEFIADDLDSIAGITRHNAASRNVI